MVSIVLSKTLIVVGQAICFLHTVVMFGEKKHHNKLNVLQALEIMYLWWDSQSKSEKIMIPRSLWVETLNITLLPKELNAFRWDIKDFKIFGEIKQ